MMNKEKDFFKTCFDTVAGLEVKNENQAIAKEVVLDEVENLQQRINDAIDVVKEIKLHYQQHPTMIPSVKINRLDEILGGKE